MLACRRIKRKALASLLSIVAFTCGNPASLGAQRGAPGAALTWQLNDVKVTSVGRTTMVDVGKYMEGHEIEGLATSLTSGSPFSKGVLRASVTAFRPHRDMPGQAADSWHTVVKWSITEVGVRSEVLSARYNPHVLSGQLSGTLSNNPATSIGRLELAGKVARAFLRDRWWASGRASLSSEHGFENGILTITLGRPALPTNSGEEARR
ncbi:MAG: hypothetical protein ACE148_00620 [Vicinamibacterales bacterium]